MSLTITMKEAFMLSKLKIAYDSNINSAIQASCRAGTLEPVNADSLNWQDKKATYHEDFKCRLKR